MNKKTVFKNYVKRIQIKKIDIKHELEVLLSFQEPRWQFEGRHSTQFSALFNQKFHFIESSKFLFFSSFKYNLSLTFSLSFIYSWKSKRKDDREGCARSSPTEQRKRISTRNFYNFFVSFFATLNTFKWFLIIFLSSSCVCKDSWFLCFNN